MSIEINWLVIALAAIAIVALFLAFFVPGRPSGGDSGGGESESSGFWDWGGDGDSGGGDGD